MDDNVNNTLNNNSKGNDVVNSFYDNLAETIEFLKSS